MSLCAAIHARSMHHPSQMPDPPQLPVVTPPPGLEAIYNSCKKIYSDQSNPLQVTAVVKYWYAKMTVTL